MPNFPAVPEFPRPSSSSRKAKDDNCCSRTERCCCAVATWLPISIVYGATAWAIYVNGYLIGISFISGFLGIYSLLPSHLQPVASQNSFLYAPRTWHFWRQANGRLVSRGTRSNIVRAVYMVLLYRSVHESPLPNRRGTHPTHIPKQHIHLHIPTSPHLSLSPTLLLSFLPCHPSSHSQ
jgi:hypothetical protein